MVNGTYGTKRPANISSEDIEIFWRYTGDRTIGTSERFQKGSSSWLTQATYKDDDNKSQQISGLYNLKLPIDQFNKKGFYTLYIKPKEIEVEILDVSTLNSYPNIKGVVFDASDLPNAFNSLVGYRIEIPNVGSRLITSSFKAEPIVIGNSSSDITYRPNETSGLIFCTVTPSASMTFMANRQPNIGSKGTKVKVVNTNFNPVTIEVEMVEHDADTISTMLEGAQLRNLDNGLITTFNEDGAVYHQASYGNIVDPKTGLHHDFKMPLDGYIGSELTNYNNIKTELENG